MAGSPWVNELCFKTKQDVDFVTAEWRRLSSHNRAYSLQVRTSHYKLRCVCHPSYSTVLQTAKPDSQSYLSGSECNFTV